MTPVDLINLPRHVAIIMDGNGRWAKKRLLARIAGHRRGTEIVDDIVTAATGLGLEHLTLYAFSKENWLRPVHEVNALMDLLKEFLIQKTPKMLREGIRFSTIGDQEMLPSSVREALEQTREVTQGCRKMTLTLALSYGSRDELVRAANRLIAEVRLGRLTGPVDAETFAGCLDTHFLPDVDLMIRTSGEMRISNFLLWQAAYAELVFLDVLWPDFTPEHLRKAIGLYQNRERRFGMTSEQVTTQVLSSGPVARVLGTAL